MKDSHLLIVFFLIIISVFFVGFGTARLTSPKGTKIDDLDVTDYYSFDWNTSDSNISTIDEDLKKIRAARKCFFHARYNGQEKCLSARGLADLLFKKHK